MPMSVSFLETQEFRWLGGTPALASQYVAVSYLMSAAIASLSKCGSEGAVQCPLRPINHIFSSLFVGFSDTKEGKACVRYTRLIMF